MKGSFAVAALAAALLNGGCSEPTAPSSVLPFNGSFEGTQTMTPIEAPFGSVNGSGTGNGTQLGQFTVEFPHTVNLVTRTAEGKFVFAANGDTLTADFTGHAQGEPPSVTIVENATITGGTGRFEGATGTFTVQRQFNPASGATEGSFDGTISTLR